MCLSHLSLQKEGEERGEIKEWKNEVGVRKDV